MSDITESSDQRHRLHIKGAQGLRDLIELFGWAKSMLIQGFALVVEVRRATRTTAQNALMWSVLTDISRQVPWMVDGQTAKLDPDEWKEILSAGLKKNQRMARGIEGGFVMLGLRTSRMTRKEMTDLIDLGHAFGTQHGVKWRRTSLGRDVPDEVIDADAREVREPLALETAQ
jgi:hypothetical protein